MAQGGTRFFTGLYTESVLLLAFYKIDQRGKHEIDVSTGGVLRVYFVSPLRLEKRKGVLFLALQLAKRSVFFVSHTLRLENRVVS